MIAFSLSTPIVLVLALLSVVLIGLRTRLELGHFVAGAVFAVYLVGVANYVLLPLRSDPELTKALGPIGLGLLVGTTPFFFPGADHLTDDQLFLNLLRTVSFGFGRSVDINDVILNSVSVVLGVAAFVLARAAYSRVFGRVSVETLGPWRHFHQTLLAT